MSFHPRDHDRLDHDAWTSALIAAATGKPHPVAGSVLALRVDVDAAVGSMPRNLHRAARLDGRSGGDGIRATLRDGTLDVDVTIRDDGRRTWVRVTHADSSVLISVEPLGRSARTGLVRAIDAPPDLARSMLRRLGAAWSDIDPSTSRSPPREDDGPAPSTTPADDGQITVRCT